MRNEKFKAAAFIAVFCAATKIWRNLPSGERAEKIMKALDDEWYNAPYSRRWHPPDKVVKAFEAFGFCWGGKWPLFDAMHFEYRPEILLLAGMTIEN